MGEINYCEVMRNISREPHRKIQDWGIKKVRDYQGLFTHVSTCEECGRLADETLEKAPPQKEKQNLN